MVSVRRLVVNRKTGKTLGRTLQRSMPSTRRFPPPWTLDEANDACFIVRDHNGQALAYVYFEDEPGRQTAAKLLSKDEARRITASGDWVNDRTHGQQFRARFLKTSEPASVEGIGKYLASGMIRGIGPAYAKKLLRAFGEKVFDVIETQADRLRE